MLLSSSRPACCDENVGSEALLHAGSLSDGIKRTAVPPFRLTEAASLLTCARTLACLSLWRGSCVALLVY